MNSLVSPTKVITNDTIPNPIVTAHNNIIPTIPVPVSSIGKFKYIQSQLEIWEKENSSTK